jgi:hypothetical protein
MYLHVNQLTGEIPDCFCTMGSMKQFNLKDNTT